MTREVEDSRWEELLNVCKTQMGRLASWNLGGQDVHKLDVAGRDLDIISVQEVSRGEEGWITENTELFHWVLHRAHDQWRATGVGFANDKLDCIIGKVATNRGVWILTRLKGIWACCFRQPALPYWGHERSLSSSSCSFCP